MKKNILNSQIFIEKNNKKRIKRKKSTLFLCVFILIILNIISYIVPVFYPYDYKTTSASKYSDSQPYLKPLEYSEKEKEKISDGEKVFPHILGTDSIGRDYAARIIYGTRISMTIGILATAMIIIIGVSYGAISGFIGGKTDLIMMRIVDIIYSLPDILIIILLSVLLRKIIIEKNLTEIKVGVEFMSVLFAFGILYWVGMARIVRGEILSLKEKEFIQAAKLMGLSPIKIILKHLIPNCLPVIIITATLQMPMAIFTESYLSFLGIGISMPIPSLGTLISESRSYLNVSGCEYIFIIPCIMIFIIVFSFNLLGDCIKEIYSKHTRMEE